MMRQSNVLDPIHTHLSELIWDDPGSERPTLKPKHEHWITHHIYSVLETGGYESPHEWLRIVLTGSLTTYQYSDQSDVDVSLFVNSSALPEWSRAEMIALMIAKADGVTLPGTPYPMQCFVVGRDLKPQDLYRKGLRSGYDLKTHTWIEPPNRSMSHNVEEQENGFYVYAMQCADKMEKLLRYEPEKATEYWHQIHHKRQRDQTLGKGDYSEANIVYKFLSNRGLMPSIAQVSGEYIASVTQRDSSDRADRTSLPQDATEVSPDWTSQSQTISLWDHGDETLVQQEIDRSRIAGTDRHTPVSAWPRGDAFAQSERLSSVDGSSRSMYENTPRSYPEQDDIHLDTEHSSSAYHPLLPSNFESTQDSYFDDIWNKSSYALIQDVSHKPSTFPAIAQQSGEYIAHAMMPDHSHGFGYNPMAEEPLDQEIDPFVRVATPLPKSKIPVSQMTPEQVEAYKAAQEYARAGSLQWLQDNPRSPENIVSHWDQTTPEHRDQGMSWYADAHNAAKQIALDRGISVNQAAGLIANYSPQQHWATNLEMASRAANGELIGGPKLPGQRGFMASRSQADVAQRILAGEDYHNIFRGKKITSFGHLIEHGQDTDPANPAVVVDRHALGVAHGGYADDGVYTHSKVSGGVRKDGSSPVYDDVSGMYRQAADAINANGGHNGVPIQPHQLQAATWLTRQRLNAEGGYSESNPQVAERTRKVAEGSVNNWNAYAAQNHPTLLGKTPGTGFSAQTGAGGGVLSKKAAFKRLKDLVEESIDYGELYVNDKEKKVQAVLGDADDGDLFEAVKDEIVRTYPGYTFDVGSEDQRWDVKTPGWEKLAIVMEPAPWGGQIEPINFPCPWCHQMHPPGFDTNQCPERLRMLEQMRAQNPQPHFQGTPEPAPFTSKWKVSMPWSQYGEWRGEPSPPPTGEEWMYHVAPVRSRERIQQMGLDPTAGGFSQGDRDDYEDMAYNGGGYDTPEQLAENDNQVWLHPTLEGAQQMKGDWGGSDIWGVNIHGLRVTPGADDWNATTTPHHILPDRLRLQSSREIISGMIPPIRPEELSSPTAIERGHSRPVSQDEWNQIAERGRQLYEGHIANADGTSGLDNNWDHLVNHSWNEVQQPWGGATINAFSGQPVPQGVDAYALTAKPPGYSTISIPIGSDHNTFRDAMAHARNHFGPLLERQNHHLGIFRDEDVKRIDFDPVLVTHNLKDSEDIGAYTRNIGGAYHFKSGDGFWPPHVPHEAAPSNPQPGVVASSLWTTLTPASSSTP